MLHHLGISVRGCGELKGIPIMLHVILYPFKIFKISSWALSVCDLCQNQNILRYTLWYAHKWTRLDTLSRRISVVFPIRNWTVIRPEGIRRSDSILRHLHRQRFLAHIVSAINHRGEPVTLSVSLIPAPPAFAACFASVLHCYEK